MDGKSKTISYLIDSMKVIYQYKGHKMLYLL